MTPYQQLLDFYRRTLRTDDSAPMDVCLATAATSATEGDALWVYVVGAPSSGKTEILRVFRDPKNESTYYLSSLTPNSLVSGLKDGKHLLPALDGKTLIVKDFTMTLEMHRENRDALFGALRDAYDGTYSKAFGSVGTVGFDSHFNLLAAVTNAIDSYYTAQSILGQRFLMVRTTFPEDFATDGERDIAAVRQLLNELVRETLKACKSKRLPPCPDGFKEEIKGLAREIALLRTHVHREGQGRDIASIPEPEAPARLANQLLKIVRGVAKVRAHSEVMAEDMDTARRVAHDTVPSMMMGLLKAIHDGTNTTDAMAQSVRLSRQTVERRLEDLTVLEAIGYNEEGRLLVYHLAREFSFLRAVESTIAEIGEPLGLASFKSPLVTPEPQRSSAEGQPTGAAPAIFSADSSTPSEYLRHTPGNEMHPKLTRAKNLMAISDRVKMRLRWNPKEPDSWVTRDVILALQLPESAVSDVEEFVVSMRLGMEP